MKIFHIIRNQLNISWFKEIVQECIHSGLGDTVYISSVFFQEPPSGTYSASNDTDLLGRSFTSNTNPLTVHFCGVYSNLWVGRFISFVNNLCAMSNYNIFINKIPYNQATYPVIQRNNHAKVFVYELAGVPLLEIIGSSNFTRRAYGTITNFNIEADLVVCNCEILENIIIQRIQQYDNQRGIMILDYDEELNKTSLIEEMMWIRDNLF